MSLFCEITLSQINLSLIFRCVKELLKRDPSILNDEDEAAHTALHLAATEGHVKCCKELLERGAEVDARLANINFISI